MIMMMMMTPLSRAYVSVIREEIHQKKTSTVSGTDGLKINLKTFNKDLTVWTRQIYLERKSLALQFYEIKV